MDNIKTFNFNQSCYGYTGSRQSFDLIFKNEKVYYASIRTGEHENYIGPETELNVGKIPDIIKTTLIPMLSTATSSGVYTNNHPGSFSSGDGMLLNYILHDLSTYISQLENMLIETNIAVDRQQDLIKKQYISIYSLSTLDVVDRETSRITLEISERDVAAMTMRLNSETERREISERDVVAMTVRLNSETERRETSERDVVAMTVRLNSETDRREISERDVAAMTARLNSETERREISEREMDVIKAQMKRDISLGFWEMI